MGRGGGGRSNLIFDISHRCRGGGGPNVILSDTGCVGLTSSSVVIVRVASSIGTRGHRAERNGGAG